MSSNKPYEYENELSIDSKLVCSICLNPFVEPKRTSCDHIFCRRCIERWFEYRATCPLCRKSLLTKHLKPVKNENILRTLDQLYVKCLLCNETNIKRKDFEHHMNNQCPEVIVSCCTKNSSCSWEGRREDLQYHKMLCCSKSNQKTSDRPVKENKLRSNLHILKIKHIISRSTFNSKICLHNRNLTENDIPLIIQSAIIDKKCKILDLGQNEIHFHGISQLADSLENNTTLEVLSLHQNSLSDISILYLSEQLSLNTSTLKWLDLESTNITDKSAEYLAIMLINNKSLTALWLSNNHIGYHGVKLLAFALTRHNTTLENLDLESNPLINDSSADDLKEIIEKNQSLNTLYVNKCQLSITSQTKLRNAANMKYNFHLFL